MAQNIGDLFFSLGLDESKLQQQWQVAMRKYEKQAINLKVQLDPKSIKDIEAQLKGLDVAGLKNQFDKIQGTLGSIEGHAQAINAALSGVKGKTTVVAGDSKEFSKNMEQAGYNALKANGYLGTHKGIMGELVSYAKRYVSLWGMVSIGRSIVRITGEIEYQRKALESVMQSTEAANRTWAQIQQLAVKSPFQVGDLLKYTKQLSAFGIENEHLYDTLKRLADVSAGLGVDLSRIALAYGEINAATVLRGKETRQLTQAGIPIIRELAKTFSELEGRIVSAGEVYKRIFSRQVSFDMVKKVFQDLTNEGGKFYQMQEKQAATLKGSIKNIADQWTLMANEIGNSQSSWMKSFVSGLKSAMANWQSWIGVLKAGLTVFLSLKVAVGAYNTYMQIHNNLITIQTSLLNRAAVSQATYEAAVKATFNTVTLLISAAVALGVAFYKYATRLNEVEKIQKTVTDTAEKMAVEEMKVAGELDYLFMKLKNAEKGTTDYENAREAIMRAYPEYFEHLRSEGREIGDLTLHYSALKNEALEAARARIIAAGREEAYAEFGKTAGKLASIQDIQENLRKTWAYGDLAKLSKAEAEVVSRYISGMSYDPAELAKAIGLSWKEGESPLKAIERWEAQAQRKYRSGASITFGEGFLSNTDIWARRQLFAKAKNALDESVDEFDKMLSEALGGEGFVGPVLKNGGLLKWQENVRSILGKYGMDEAAAGSLWVDETTNINDYVSALRKNREALVEELRNYKAVPGSGDIEKTESRINAIDEILKSYNLPLSTKIDAGDSDAEKAVIDAIRIIDEQLQWVEKVREFYRRLKELGMTPEEAQRVVEGVFGTHANLPTGMTLSTALISDNKTLLTTFKGLYDRLGKEGAKASENMQQKILSEEAKQVEDSLKAAKKIDDKLKEWGAHDFEVGGEGSLFKLSKIMADLNSKNDKVRLESQELLAANEKTKDIEGYERRKELIKELAELEIQYNNKVAQEKVDSMGEAFTKEAIKQLDIAFKNAGIKSIKYLKDALDKFKAFSSVFGGTAEAKILESGLAVSDLNGGLDWNSLASGTDEEFAKALETSGLTDIEQENLKSLREAAKTGANINKLVFKIAEKLGVAQADAEQKYTKQEADWVKQIAGWNAQIGSAVGGKAGSIITTIGNLGKTAYTLSKNWKNEGFDRTGAAIGMIVDGITGMYSAISGVIKHNKQKAREWAAAIEEATQAMRLNAIEQKAYKQSNVWGVESPYKQIQAAAAQYAEGVIQLNKAAQEIIENGKLRKKLKLYYDPDTAAGMGAAGATAGAGVGWLASMGSGAAGGSAGGPYGIIIGAVIGLVAGLLGAGLAKKNYYKTNKLSDIYGQIYDPKTYELNQNIINDYAKMNDETKKLIDNWEEIKEKIKEADEEMEQQISEMTGNLGSDIKDMLVQAFSDGDIYAAIDDIDEYLGNVIKNIAIQQAYAAVFGNVFDTLQQRMKDSFNPFGGDQDLTDDLLWFRDEMPKYFEGFGKVLEIIQDGLSSVGLDTNLSGTTTGSSAISGVTEETASRLLGQINAIRADVSVKRALLEAYLPNIGTINDTMAGGLATLREIEVNTRRGADISAEIRDLFSSVMGVSNSSAGMAINVNIG